MESCPIIYVDIESDNNRKIIEFAALCVNNGFVVDELHFFVTQPLANKFAYIKTAENSHCIDYRTLLDKGIEWFRVSTEFYKLVDSWNQNVIIKGYGSDVDEKSLKAIFPFLSNMTAVTYEQVDLPKWADRQYEHYHIAAFNLKTNSKIISCNHLNHKMKYYPNWISQGKSPTHTQIAKRSFGFHCALIDTYELAFKDKRLNTYCCDCHFSSYFCTNDTNAHLVSSFPSDCTLNSQYSLSEN